MINLLGNLAKAAVAIAVTPVGVAVDVALLPAKLVSSDPNVRAFAATEACLTIATDSANKRDKP